MMKCCVTGNRPQKFPWKYGEGPSHKKYLENMANRIERLIKCGYEYFISGGALGVDLDFAESVLVKKQVYTNIKLEIAMPCRTQAARWSDEECNRYSSILQRADKVSVLSERYSPFCMQKRNEYMVDKSDIIIAFWNGEREGGTWNTISYAMKRNKALIINFLSAR